MAPAFSFTAYLLTLPAEFLHWWFIESTFNLLKIMQYVLKQSYNFLGIRLLFKTFFKPWKNEYREGLVRFSLFMGMFFKSMFLFVDVLFFFGLILILGFIFIFWVLLPFLVLFFAVGGVYAIVFT